MKKIHISFYKICLGTSGVWVKGKQNLEKMENFWGKRFFCLFQLTQWPVLILNNFRFSPYEWDNPHPCIEEPEVLVNEFRDWFYKFELSTADSNLNHQFKCFLDLYL